LRVFEDVGGFIADAWYLHSDAHLGLPLKASETLEARFTPQGFDRCIFRDWAQGVPTSAREAFGYTAHPQISSLFRAHRGETAWLQSRLRAIQSKWRDASLKRAMPRRISR
jgi:hypothetical protein